MDDIPTNLPDKPIRFMDQFRVFIRSKQLAYKTEKTYCTWVVDFIRYHNMQHPKHLGGLHVDEYLSHLAVKRNLAINTQKTALNALVFMFKQFLGADDEFDLNEKQHCLNRVFRVCDPIFLPFFCRSGNKAKPAQN